MLDPFWILHCLRMSAHLCALGNPLVIPDSVRTGKMRVNGRGDLEVQIKANLRKPIDFINVNFSARTMGDMFGGRDDW